LSIAKAAPHGVVGRYQASPNNELIQSKQTKNNFKSTTFYGHIRRLRHSHQGRITS